MDIQEWITAVPWRSTLEVLVMIATILTPFLIWQGFRLERRKVARKDLVFDIEHKQVAREITKMGYVTVAIINTEPIAAVVERIAVSKGSVFDKEEVLEFVVEQGRPDYAVRKGFDPNARQKTACVKWKIDRNNFERRDDVSSPLGRHFTFYVPASYLSDNSLRISFTWRWSDERRSRKTRRYMK
ncbi:MAG: hypothetical protein AAFN44_16820 [Pseudomonadota bacterium]